MNPNMEPFPISGDIVLLDGTILPAEDLVELVSLLNGLKRARHQCISKGQLQDLAGQLLVRNRLLEKQLATAQATIETLSSPRYMITDDCLPKMTDEEMIKFRALLDNGVREYIRAELDDMNLSPITAVVSFPDGSTRERIVGLPKYGSSLSMGRLPDRRM